MTLGLCSGAAPGASFEELVDAALRRGLTVIELREGDAHGVDATTPLEAAAAVEYASARGLRISAFRAARAADPLRLARLAELLDAPILVDGRSGSSARIDSAARIAEHGSPAAVVVRGADAADQARAVRARGLSVAWDADPEVSALGRTLADLLDVAGAELAEIRLRGGGPEAVLHEGKGIGEMAARLALAGYRGTLVLTPSSARYRVAWETWLGRRGGWGCGGKTAAPQLVRLAGTES